MTRVARSRIRPRVPLLGCVVILISFTTARAEVALPSIFGDHMVMQRGADLRFHGTAEPGERVAVRTSWGAFATEAADSNGAFDLLVPTTDDAGPHEITIEASNTITLRDVWLGDVWICSGQSNMEWATRQSAEGADAIPKAHHPGIRLFRLQHATSFEPEDDCRGSWQVCSPDAVRNFSGVAYYFGQDIHEASGVPIGLVQTTWGGTPAEAWTSLRTLRDEPDFSRYVEGFVKAEVGRAALERAQAAWPAKNEAWQHELAAADPGLGGDEANAPFAQPAHDDSAWQPIDLPATYRAFGQESFDGIIWFRTTVTVPPGSSEQEWVLELGAIDDHDITWVDGRRIGATDNHRTARVYTIGRLAPGRHTLAVRTHDTGGAGGFTGSADGMVLRTSDNTTRVAIAEGWRYHVGPAQSELPAQPAYPNAGYQRVGSMLFHAMIHPLLKTRIRGAIWYQGESNTRQSYLYRKLFPAMIRDWREAWGQGDFPFYFVQIAPFGYANTSVSHELREAQRLTLDVVPNTGMAITMDIGNPRDIHPRKKKPVGERLARWARADVYDETNLVVSGPLYRSLVVETVHENSTQFRAIRLHFDHTGSGLATRDGARPSHFVIAGRDRQFHPASARIEEDTVLVWSDHVPDPVAVRYGWSNAAEPNLMNREGLPASSFRTDAWPAVTRLASMMKPRGYSIPIVDLDSDSARQIVVDREPGQYLGHPSTVLLEDGRTMIVVYPKGHGRGAIVMKRSEDGGLTWSDRLAVPESFSTSQETPTIYRTIAPDGTRRLILFSGLHPIRMSVSENDGTSWSELEPIGDFGGIVAMSDLLRAADGSYIAQFHDDGRFIAKPRTIDNRFRVYQTRSRDGGLTWSSPRVIALRDDAGLCEPGLIRSPDGKTIACLLRENYRKYNSMILFSSDEGETWSEPVELPAALTGDRHQLLYAPDGRIVASFRDTTHESSTKGDWVGWVGTWDDLVKGREGQYRIRFKDNHVRSDCAYPALELLPDGTFVNTTYGHWDEGESPYILSVRFTLDELDSRL